MEISINKIDESFKKLEVDASDFFNSINEDDEIQNSISTLDSFDFGPKLYWDVLSETLRDKSKSIQKLLLSTVGIIQGYIKLSPLLTEVDELDLIQCIKSMRASLNLREYKSFGVDVIHDEGTVLGVNPPSQSEEHALSPREAKKAFDNYYTKTKDIFDLVKSSPISTVGNISDHNKNVPASYRPNTAFLIMQISPNDSKVQDIYDAYVECFEKFGIKAIRADDIEHEEIITSRIIDEIKNSEYLLGDLSGQRPNVYYEVGYAHALGRSVILFTGKDSSIHFDLAAYNCPHYDGLRDLKSKLLKRLETVTNRKPSK
jgi:hypothetical protein